jgi:hypothetical protein
MRYINNTFTKAIEILPPETSATHDGARQHHRSLFYGKNFFAALNSDFYNKGPGEPGAFREIVLVNMKTPAAFTLKGMAK